MWYEILPSFCIIVACMSAPQTCAFVMNWLVLGGNIYRRGLLTQEYKKQYLRDLRLTGDAYKVAGLENIPDEECPKENPGEEHCEDENENEAEEA